ncbi:MAG: DUF3857 domain-containing transglutaminase family protein [Flavobacteriales bacterium]
MKSTALTLFLFFFYSIAFSADKIKISDPADWVSPAEPKTESIVDTYELNSGFYYTLSDVQMNLEEESDYYHYSQKITNFSAVKQASQIMINYDPTYQDVVFHSLIIKRKGEEIDRTSEIEFELLNNEGQLISGVYMGDVTAYALLSDIRKDDEIEYSFTVNGYNPIFEDDRFSLNFLEGSEPIDRLNLVIQYSEKSGVQVKYKDVLDSDFKTTEKNGMVIKTYLKDDIPAVKLEESMSPNVIPFKYVVVHSHDSWSEVQDWAKRVFKHKKTAKLNDLLADIFKPKDDLETKIQKSIEYVQNDVRYMAIHSGIGSHKPRHPNEVIESRFGDCKDKSNLLAQILNELGVESASPALVNTYMKDGVTELPPSGAMFDHCIVYFQQGGEDYWIDPTATNMGGTYKDRNYSYYKKALVLNGKEAIRDMDYIDDISGTSVYEQINLSSFEDTCYFKITTSYKGDNTVGMRNTLEYYSLKDVSDNYMAYYSSVFSNLSEYERLRITDDIDSNQINMYEHYAIREPWTETESYGIERLSFTYEPLSLYDYVRPLRCEKKNFPVNIVYPAKYFQNTELKLPRELGFSPFEVNFDNSAFTYLYKAERVDPLTILLTYSFHTKTDVVTPEEFEKVCKDLSDISEQITFSLTYPKNEPSEEDMRKAIMEIIKNSEKEK